MLPLLPSLKRWFVGFSPSILPFGSMRHQTKPVVSTKYSVAGEARKGFSNVQKRREARRGHTKPTSKCVDNANFIAFGDLLMELCTVHTYNFRDLEMRCHLHVQNPGLPSVAARGK